MFLPGWKSVWWGIPVMCRDHRCLTTCQKQHRQNDRAGQVDIPTILESLWWGILDRCRDHRRLMICQKQHRQNELAGQVDVPTSVKVRVIGDSGHVKGPQMSHWMSKTKQTEWTSWSGRCYYQVGGPCAARSRTCVGTTDVSRPVKKQHRQNELAGQVDVPTSVKVRVMVDPGHV